MLTVPDKYKNHIGTYFEISDEEYHGGGLNLISAHGLKECLRSYNHLKASKEAKTDSDAMNFGTLAHIMALEPERFARTVREAPLVDRRTTKGKETYAAFLADLGPGQKACSADDMARLKGMQKKIREEVVTNPAISFLFDESNQTEKAGIFPLLEEVEIGPGAGVGNIYAKFKPDRVGQTWIMDYKTCQDAWQWKFAYDAKKMHYDMQLFFYQHGDLKITGDGIPKRLLVFAQESEPPYEFQAYEVPQVFHTQAHELIQRAVTKFWTGITDTQPGYPREILQLDLTRGY